ncbi:unnamed protein product [Arctia plantaginis]|uniref:Protein Jumonji n=1 Tax=Arctia plantaginis TaxID=874455 RepID=A0A8S0Z447_ARCPL|nr:unnamed protein product [Arctia plantaginis]
MMETPGRRKRKRATTTVTAQRKFAQGALVPTAAAAGPSNAITSSAERRDASATSDDSNIFHSNMSAKSLLDVVSLQSMHSRMDPLVLVEKLKGKNSAAVVNSAQRPVDAINRERGSKVSVNTRSKSRVVKPKVVQLQKHTMCLRERQLINKPVKLSSAGSFRTESLDTESIHSLFVPGKARRVKKNTQKKTPRRNKRQSNFSLEDNRPLMYFVNNSTPSTNTAARVTNTVMGPPTYIPPRNITTPSISINMSQQDEPMSTLSDMEHESCSYQSEIDVMPSPSPHALAPLPTPAPERSKPTSYYSTQGIRRWIDSLSNEEIAPIPSTSTSTQQTDLRYEEATAMVYAGDSWQPVEEVAAARRATPPTMQQVDTFDELTNLDLRYEDSPMETETPMICTADSWHTVEEIVKASRSAFNARCTMCRQCERIEKLIKLTALLMRQKKIDWLAEDSNQKEEEPRAGPSSRPCDSDDLLDGDFICELLPPNRHLVVKITVTTINASKKYTAGLIPRPETAVTKRFSLNQHEHILDEVIETLSLRLGDPPSHLVSGSRDRPPQFEIPDFIKNPEKEIDDSMDNKTILEAPTFFPTLKELELDGLEVNLPKFYNVVQRLGGLEHVIDKKKWGKVADEMKLNRNPMIERKLDSIYFKYLLPFDTLSDEERAELLLRVEKAWNRKYQKLLDRASNPLLRQQCILDPTKAPAPSSSSQNDVNDDAIRDIEDCIKPGIKMTLAKFRKIASTAYENLFRNNAVLPKDIEDEYWRQVTLANDHICVHSAHVDTREQGLGFVPRSDGDYRQEPLNLKGVSAHPSNVLKSLGPVLGVTIPTLHLGMVFSTSCWHRDPHSIPWIEYSHHGAMKIWYGVAEQDESEFQNRLKTLNPAACQQKRLWLSSDITMVPPPLLRERAVKVYRLEQLPGEYVMVMPRAYSCYISTGYNVSESAYFATERWLDNLKPVFDEVRESCEPTMFALEQILKCIAEDPNSKISVLKRMKPTLDRVFGDEIENRRAVERKGVKSFLKDKPRHDNRGRGRRPMNNQSSQPPAWNVRDEDECEICRCTLYLSKGVHLPTRDSCLCLDHFLQVLATTTYEKTPVSELEAHYFYSTEELLNTMKIVRSRLELGDNPR